MNKLISANYFYMVEEYWSMATHNEPCSWAWGEYWGFWNSYKNIFQTMLYKNTWSIYATNEFISEENFSLCFRLSNTHLTFIPLLGYSHFALCELLLNCILGGGFYFFLARIWNDYHFPLFSSQARISFVNPWDYRLTFYSMMTRGL